jgi:hypothetical protein
MLFSNDFLNQLPALSKQFAKAQPFKHVVIDSFLDDAVCQRLLEDFPAFEKRYALNEMGELGGKAVRMDMPRISDAYQSLDAFLRSPEFLRHIEQLTGIPELLYDPDYIGGGTHENVQGQGLDPHVDFNVLPNSGWHRRLNLIVYLNAEWQAEWGGCLELEADPWRGEDPNKIQVLPLLNRCVVFETNEISWHGFTAIELPEDRRQLTRKSIAIYLYTKTRPAEETVAPHGTIYVPRGIPHSVQAGEVLSDAGYVELRQRFAQLRGQLKYLYQRELEYSAQLKNAERALAEARAACSLPIEGFLRLEPSLQGFWPDAWCARTMKFAFCLTRPAKSLVLTVWVPPEIAQQELQVDVAGRPAVQWQIRGGNKFVALLELSGRSQQRFEISIRATQVWQPASEGLGDLRELAFKWVAAVCE